MTREKKLPDADDEKAKFPVTLRVSRNVSKMVKFLASSWSEREGRTVKDGEVLERLAVEPLAAAYQQALKAERR